MPTLSTTRFGTVDYESGDVLRFPEGLPGFETCQEWILLADSETDLLGWLQAIDFPDVALAVVSPRRFVPEYQVRVDSRELAPLALDDPSAAQVLVVVSEHDDELTLNLKAPLVFNLERGLGRQTVAKGEWLLEHRLGSAASAPRQAA
jgi:flagellar assembly factor FliW